MTLCPVLRTANFRQRLSTGSGANFRLRQQASHNQMHDGRGKNHQAYLWQYSRPAGAVVFDFRMGREREGPKRFLGNFEGTRIAQHHAQNPTPARPGVGDLEAIKLNPRDQTSIGIVAQMDELFAVDEQARKENLNPSDRHLLRLEKAKPLLEQIKTAILAARGDALPNSALAKACNYTLTLWQRLIRFLENPVLELSNNLAENAIRPVALGRRNWIHIGSKEAGPRVAAIISVVETCRRLKIPVRDYLGSVLPGLGDFPISRIAELTPAARATRN